jgi:CCAAT/enhancer binding protein (C/EBP)
MYPTDQTNQQKVQQIHNMNTNTTNNNNNNNNNSNNNNNANPLRIKHFPLSEHSDRELAELATQEISLDLQGLIDETHFPDDNLFGDLIETYKKNDVGLPMGRGATPSSGSSGQNSPGSEGQNSPPAYNPYARNTLAYLPGSVHNGASFAQMGPVPPQHHHQQNIQVKQEPVDQDFSNSCSQAPTSTTNTPYNPNNYNNGVSSSTPHPSDQMSPVLPFNLGGPLPSLKSFATVPKYLSNKKKGNGGDKCSDEYRRRRERNNVAVRKSREKAKMRTRETEDRVKILARENERLQKKVELLQEELSVLRSLFSSVGVLPDHIHRELAKHLDNFQAQHAAMNY